MDSISQCHAAELAAANRRVIDDKSLYDALRRRGLTKQAADKVSGYSVATRIRSAVIDRIKTERAIQRRKFRCPDDIAKTVAVYDRWHQDGFDVTTELAGLGAELLAPGSLTD